MSFHLRTNQSLKLYDSAISGFNLNVCVSKLNQGQTRVRPKKVKLDESNCNINPGLLKIKLDEIRVKLWSTSKFLKKWNLKRNKPMDYKASSGLFLIKAFGYIFVQYISYYTWLPKN